MNRILTPLLLLTLLTGCSATPNPSQKICDPGATQQCVCPKGAQGAQVCETNGKSWGYCDCGNEPTPDSVQSPDSVQEDGGNATDGTDGQDGTDSTDGTSAEDGTDGIDEADTTDGADGTTDTQLPSCDQDSDCPAKLPYCTPQGVCVFCYPGKFYCDGNKSMVCDNDGTTWSLKEDCTQSGTACNQVGVCESPCGGFAKLAGTNAGCEFYAVDLRNAQESLPAKFLDAQNAQFAVIASNTSENLAANVTLVQPDGTKSAVEIAPQSLHKFLLPNTFGLEGTGSGKSAFRLTASQPIVAYQFNPLSNEDVFSNDASVLLPVSEQGTEYYVLTWDHFGLNSNKQYPAYFTVVGIGSDSTQVTVKVTANTKGGDNIKALQAGETIKFQVNQAEVYNIESTSGDLTGTHITADAPIMVFTGHTGTWTAKECCADHLEQQMPPVSSWGKTFAVGRSIERGAEPDYFRVLSSEAGTTVTMTTSNGKSSFNMAAAGQLHVFKTYAHVQLKSNKPILVAQFLASKNEIGIASGPCTNANDCGKAYKCEPSSSNSANNVCQAKTCTNSEECGVGYTCAIPLTKSGPKECTPIGDPAMMLAVPVEQWQSSYVFLTPDSYVLDYVNIVSSADNSITLDGKNVEEMTKAEPILGTEYVVYRTPIIDGVHVLESKEPVALTVYGYDNAVSYGYPGGMGLKTVNK